MFLNDCKLWSIPAKSQNLTMKSCPPVTSRAPEGSKANADTYIIKWYTVLELIIAFVSQYMYNEVQSNFNEKISTIYTNGKWNGALIFATYTGTSKCMFVIWLHPWKKSAHDIFAHFDLHNRIKKNPKIPNVKFNGNTPILSKVFISLKWY